VLPSPDASVGERSRCALAGERNMFSNLLLSFVIVPVILGVLAGRSRSRGGPFLLLLGTFSAYAVLYMFLLHYLKYRWVG
jgi:hypothetical protein